MLTNGATAAKMRSSCLASRTRDVVFIIHIRLPSAEEGPEIADLLEQEHSPLTECASTHSAEPGRGERRSPGFLAATAGS